MSVCACERGDPEQSWLQDECSWALLVFLLCLFLLTVLQELGAVLCTVMGL